MDSGSWFAIWAICLKTSFFVMMPRSLLEKKQNRGKGSALQYWLMPSLNPRALSTRTHRDISQLSLQLGGDNRVGSGQRHVGREERWPSQVTCTFPDTLSPQLAARGRGASEGLEVTEDWLRKHQIQRPGGPWMTIWCRAHACWNPHWVWRGGKWIAIVLGHWDGKLANYSNKPTMTNTLSWISSL